MFLFVRVEGTTVWSRVLGFALHNLGLNTSGFSGLGIWGYALETVQPPQLLKSEPAGFTPRSTDRLLL